MPRFIFSLSVVLCTICTSAALAGPVALTVTSQIDRANSPTIVDLAVPAQMSMDDAKALAAGGFTLMPGNVFGQAELIKDNSGKVTAVRVYWVEPELKAGTAKTYTIDHSQKRSPMVFKFEDGANYRDLYYGSTPVWRHDQLVYDKDNHVPTFKHFHQVYDFHGNGFITQGNDGTKFPHHRGLFIGWKTTTVGGKNYDTWHCTNGVADQHKSFVADRELTGPVVARSTSLAEWTGGDGKLLVTERREVTTWKLSGGAIAMDFDFLLTAGDGDVQLNGDPQHAGFQFRPHGDVVSSKAKYVYPATAKAKGGDVWTGCPWVTNTFKIKDHAYAVVYLDHPENPGTKEGTTVFSTRDYGRFGAFAKHELKKGSPLAFHYRIIVMDADKDTNMAVERFDGMHAAFVEPLKVELGSK